MYVVTADLDTLLGTTGDTTAKQQAIDSAEALFNQLCGSETGLVSSIKTEYHKFDDEGKPYKNRNSVFDLGTYKPTALTTINGKTPAAFGASYAIRGNRLYLSNAAPSPTEFPWEYAIVYVSGFSTVPADVKAAVLHLAAAFYNTRNAQGVESFKQDLLSVTYSKTGPLVQSIGQDATDFVTATARAYSVELTIG